MRSKARPWLALVIVALGGCSGARTVVDHPAAQRWGSDEAQLEFFDALAGQAIVTNDDALHAMLLFMTGTSPADFEQRLEAAIALGWIDQPPGHANESAQIGLIASIAVRSRAIEPELLLGGGGPWHAGGLAGLAATKRLRALRMLPPRSPEQALTGAELLALLRRVELYEQAADDGLGGEL